MRRPVQQFGDVDGNEVPTVGQPALASCSSAVRVARSGSARITSSMTHGAASAVMSRVDSTEVGAYRRQRVRSRGRPPRRNSGRLQRGRRAGLLIPDTAEHALHRVTDLDGLTHTADLRTVRFDCALMARAAASSRNGLTITSEINQPTSSAKPAMKLPQISSTRRCCARMRFSARPTGRLKDRRLRGERPTRWPTPLRVIS